jgi:acyl-coenzyme A thioesterase PaaI-like protein
VPRARETAIAAVRTIAAQLARRTDVSGDEAEALVRLQRRFSGPENRALPAPGQARTHENVDPFFPDVSYEVDGTGLRGSVRFSPVFEGAGGVAHGGYIAAVFDDALGAAALARTMSRTASMTVDYRAPVPIEHDLVLSAQVESTEDRKLWVAGRIADGQNICAEARGLWIAVAAY